MAQVDEAEKEASEVLHSLLSVERIEKPEIHIDDTHESPKLFQIDDTHEAPKLFQIKQANDVETDTQMQWSTQPALTAHAIFQTIDGNTHFQSNQIDEQPPQVVIWEGHAIQVSNGGSSQHLATIYPEIDDADAKPVVPKASKSPKKAASGAKSKMILRKKKKAVIDAGESTKLEESSAQVKERFKRGCECQDESCFRGLNADSVYKHRLNIAELTKGEHDMYLMGVTMACLANPDTTVRHKERRRLRAQYVYQGRRVCLDAFLYLENCTHYQLKRIRKHVMTHGVAPRVHGNHGKKPHNTFSLDIYYHATEFLKQYLEQYTGERDVVSTKQPIQLPWDVTRKNLHDAYKEYGQVLEPGIKLMGYSTFRHFMKDQFPHVKFCKIEPKAAATAQNQQTSASQEVQGGQQQQHMAQKNELVEHAHEQQHVQKCIIGNEVQQVIPLVVAPSDGNGGQHQQTFLVTPVSQLINGAQNAATGNAYSYQLTNTSYVINDPGNIVTTMANTQHHAPYAFSRMQ